MSRRRRTYKVITLYADNLSTGHLIQLVNRYCKGVIAEGVETYEEWIDVQSSPAFAAQGYYLSRPVPSENLENVLIQLP